MRKISNEELNQILENHKHWIKRDCEGWENMRADLSNTNLSGIALCYANLSGVILTNANLVRSRFNFVRFDETNFKHANLSGSIFYNSSLIKANMVNAILSNVDFSYANLQYVDFDFADCRHAYFHRANLSNACFKYSKLLYANFSYANLHKTLFLNVENMPHIPYACPDIGSFIGWKQARSNDDGCYTVVVVELEILADARRCSGAERKCRCDKAKVISIKSLDGSKSYNEAFSIHDHSFVYKVGEIVEEKAFDENRWNECSKGIHFFINRQEAINYI